MANKILTMESLVEFCKSYKTFSFNSKEAGHPLAVNVIGTVNFSSNEDESDLMPVELKSCHIGLNRNGSHISEDSMNKAIPSFANKPILAEIVRNSNDELDFGTHAIELVEDEDGNTVIHYIEKPVGIIPESFNPRLIYDKEKDKTYLYVNGYIFKLYGNETANILQRKNGTKVSIEIDIHDMAWDAKNKWLDILEFEFSAITLLGEDYGEGMLGSRCDISDFSHYSSLDYTKEINEMKSRLSILESQFSNKNNSKEGGKKTVSKFDELLAKYGKTVEDIDFEYEGLSDEELEAKFAEVFADGNDPDTSSEDNSGKDNADDNTGDSGDSSSSENDDTENDSENNVLPKQQEDDDSSEGASKKNTNEFALSLQEKVNALYELVSSTYEEADNEWYGLTCYENPNYVIMHGYFNGRHYKQNYKVENDEYSLVGDRIQVYEQFLTQEEIDELAKMKANYASLVEYKANAEKAEFESKRNEILADSRYEVIKDTEEYKALMQDAEKYSLEELETKLKLIIADFALGNGNFSKFSKQNNGRMFTIPSKGENIVTSKYGGIFTD